MSSPAKLPSMDVREELARLLELAEEVRDGLYNLCSDADWKVWNDGGAPWGKPQFSGPAGKTAEELVREADRLADRLQAVDESFEHRARREAERAELRRRAAS